jgi:hypothetical protein
VPLCFFLRPLQSGTLRLHGCGIQPISTASHNRDMVVPESEHESLTPPAVPYTYRMKSVGTLHAKSLIAPTRSRQQTCSSRCH